MWITELLNLAEQKEMKQCYLVMLSSKKVHAPTTKQLIGRVWYDKHKCDQNTQDANFARIAEN